MANNPHINFHIAMESIADSIDHIEDLLQRLNILHNQFITYESSIRAMIETINYEKAIDLHYQHEY